MHVVSQLGFFSLLLLIGAVIGVYLVVCVMAMLSEPHRFSIDHSAGVQFLPGKGEI